MKTKIQVQNEIGVLKSVLIHSPGGEMNNMLPNKRDEWLLDDILETEIIQNEYSHFVTILLLFLDPQKIDLRKVLDNKIVNPNDPNYHKSDFVIDVQYKLAELFADIKNEKKSLLQSSNETVTESKNDSLKIMQRTIEDLEKKIMMLNEQRSTNITFQDTGIQYGNNFIDKEKNKIQKSDNLMIEQKQKEADKLKKIQDSVKLFQSIQFHFDSVKKTEEIPSEKPSFFEKDKTEELFMQIDKLNQKIEEIKSENTKKIAQNPNILYIAKISEPVKLRKRPNASGKEIGIFKEDDICIIVSKETKLSSITIYDKIGNYKEIKDYWYKVDCGGGKEGWVFGYYTSKKLSEK